ncbi:MAG: hypothetical protein ACSLE6_09450 [Mycobacterium sp.]
MKDKRGAPARNGAERRRKPGAAREAARRRPVDPPPRRRGPRGAQTTEKEQRALRSGPKTTPVRRPTPPKNAKQAKARAKARKAKAPKVVRPPLRDRLATRLATIDMRPRTLAAKVPFVVLVIGSLGVGLGATLSLSTYSAERSYELGSARETNRLLQQQKESLERDVQEAQAAPALAEAARNLGMIPSRDTAHLVQDPAGNWVVVGTPTPAEGSQPPPLNVVLPDDESESGPSAAAASPAATAPGTNTVEVPVLVPSPAEVVVSPVPPVPPVAPAQVTPPGPVLPEQPPAPQAVA